MANVKWTELPTGTPAGTDLIPYVEDPGGTPVNKTTTVDDLLPWHVGFLPAVTTADATTGTWAQNNPTDIDTTRVTTASFNNTSAAQNDAVAWDLILVEGTWDVHCWVRKSTNTGIITVQFDGVDKGTVDTYVSPTPIGAKVSVTGCSVPATGKVRVNFKAATKHASSSAYVINLAAIELRRTA